jgi:hypothetical protein
MDYKFLNNVVGQIVSETRINYRTDMLSFFFDNVFKEWVPFDFNYQKFLLTSFYNHCRDVYGLNDEESEYVWGEYVMRIRHLTIHSYKRKNNGL